MEGKQRFLFVGNSATYVNDLPAMLVSLCEKKGIDITQKQLVKGGYFLKQHAEDSAVFDEISKGYDLVFLQENGHAMTSPEACSASLAAGRKLADAVRKAGSACWIYVRPPYGHDLASINHFDQCILFDNHFTPAAREWGARCVYINRAFAYAIKYCNLPLWGPDNAHLGIHGAYLAVCTFYATLFGRSASELDTAYDLPEQDAEILRQIADKIARDGIVPWEE